MEKKFNQAEYWIKRHQDLKGDPRSVGNLGASLADNESGERELQTVVSWVADELRTENAQNVLDLGCGYGRIAGCFLNRGFDYTGVDISSDAIADARASHPTGRFLRSDIGSLDLNETFDIVLVLYVFVHFVDDGTWSEFLDTAISHVKPGGTLVFADHFTDERTSPVSHVVWRPLAEYSEIFEKRGLDYDLSLREAAAKIPASQAKQFYFARKR